MWPRCVLYSIRRQDQEVYISKEARDFGKNLTWNISQGTVKWPLCACKCVFHFWWAGYNTQAHLDAVIVELPCNQVPPMISPLSLSNKIKSGKKSCDHFLPFRKTPYSVIFPPVRVSRRTLSSILLLPTGSDPPLLAKHRLSYGSCVEKLKRDMLIWRRPCP